MADMVQNKEARFFMAHSVYNLCHHHHHHLGLRKLTIN